MSAVPNATHLLNTSDIFDGMDATWRQLLSAGVRDMISLNEAHAADMNALKIPIEDLLTFETSNATLVQMLRFLFSSAPETIISELRQVLWQYLSAAIQDDHSGIYQRKHLTKLLKHRAAKCHHVAKIQAALGYSAMDCDEKVVVHSPQTRRLNQRQLRSVVRLHDGHGLDRRHHS